MDLLKIREKAIQNWGFIETMIIREKGIYY